MKKEYGIFIGRFQPMHEGHIHALKTAASMCRHLLIMIGSSNQVRSIKNPWTFEERAFLVNKTLRNQGVNNFTLVPLNDHPYNDPAWIAEVKIQLNVHSGYHYALNPMDKPTLFGHFKEGNSYLKWFPDFKYQEIPSPFKIDATSIRQELFKTRNQKIPQTVQSDWDFYEKEKELFENYPFPETLNFNCSDAILLCLDKVLLIQRKNSPGKGAWALPGGFKNRNETFLDCAIRELQEETNVRVPEKVLRGSIVKTQIFDSPTRSFGIPRNTMAVMFQIQPDKDGKPPRANGADDAAECKWVDLDDALNALSLYDDHCAILSTMTGIVPRPLGLSNV